MTTAKRQNSASSINELEFREWFYNEFGTDYIDAVNKLNEQKKETERKWNQTLIKHGLNKN